MRKCQDSCPKIKQNQESKAQLDGSSYTEYQAEDPNSSSRIVTKDVNSNHRSPSQRQKSVQIGGLTVVEAVDSRSTRSSQSSGDPESIEIDRKHIPGPSPTEKQNGMSGRVASSPKGREYDDWNPNGHDPCMSSCPISNTRNREARKAQLRQERLDHYLLTKGFSYFDDLCTCSSICLINQLRRDKFVLDMLKSACLFTLGMKLCEELDAWNMIG